MPRIRRRCVALGSFFPWCLVWEAELRTLFAAYVVAKQQQHVLDYDDLLLYWAQMMQEPSPQPPQLVSVRDAADQARYVVEKVLEPPGAAQESSTAACRSRGRPLPMIEKSFCERVSDSLLRLWKRDRGVVSTRERNRAFNAPNHHFGCIC